ncbi:transmembrane protein 69 [Xenopus laevis]|uniref:Transmembrane protein 69 n=2 Tax=Xenopus laevis TaxID=8355 RepID=A0A974D5W7_XENLA|nr:transmembrane protein 69 [Xenopus laevis]OCT84906.1 hypothetical protein XELAEV_18023066mg [Xenopus laevis]
MSYFRRCLPLARQITLLNQTAAPVYYTCQQRISSTSSRFFTKTCLFTLYRPILQSTSSNSQLKIHTSSHHLKRRKIEEEPEKRELDLLRYDMKALKDAPKPALYLGLAGLIPFVSAPLLMTVTQCYYPEVAFAQVAYGASILSFLGGVRWGFAIPESSPAKPDWMNLTNSTVPSLLAWLALLFKDNINEAAVLVVMGLGIALHYDLALLPTYPSWFKALRAILTVVAVFSLIGCIINSSVYPHKSLVSNEP